MRGRLLGLLLVAAVSFPATAAAAPVLVMGRDGHVHRRTDRFLPATAVTPSPRSRPAVLVQAPAGGAVSFTGGTGILALTRAGLAGSLAGTLNSTLSGVTFGGTFGLAINTGTSAVARSVDVAGTAVPHRTDKP